MRAYLRDRANRDRDSDLLAGRVDCQGPRTQSGAVRNTRGGAAFSGRCMGHVLRRGVFSQRLTTHRRPDSVRRRRAHQARIALARPYGNRETLSAMNRVSLNASARNSAAIALILTLTSVQVPAADDVVLRVQLRNRVKQSDGRFKEVRKRADWSPKETAIIIVDMWNDHHFVSAAKRVVEMAPHMNRVVKAARDRGVLIIHAPSGCDDFYKGQAVRRNAESAPVAKAGVGFKWNYFNPEHEGPLAGKLEAAGCSCDTPNPCGPDRRVWESQIKAIEMTDADAATSNGQEIHNLLESRGIKNVIIMGVHTNRCVLGRPFGIRQMVYQKRNVVLCRDLTDSYHRDPGKHFEGLEKIVEHVEKYWCPTITSKSITGEKPFRFSQAGK